jgi:ubiquinone biosynthesis protein Coq4
MLGKLRFFYHLLKFAKDPTQTLEVFRFTDTLVAISSPEERRKFSDVFLEDAASRAMYEANEDRLLRRPFRLDELAKCPSGSLGRAYHDVMTAAGLDPEFFAYNVVDDAASFFTLRLRKTHDIYHVLTGFGTDVPSEIGLQSFYLGQMHLPVPLSIMVSALLFVITKRDVAMIRDTCEKIVFGYQSGVRAAKLHGVVWEDYWHQPLDQVRRKFGITPFAGVAAAA